MASRNPPPPSSATLRLFWGLRLDAPAAAGLGRWREGAEPLLPGARWTHPGDLHLTLAFLGGRSAGEVAAILAAGAAAAAGARPIRLQGTGLGAFPSATRARILWLGWAANPGLATLAARLRAAMAPFGCRSESGPWVPHATLARFKSPTRLPPLPPAPAVEWAAEGLELLRSEPTGPGPHYHTLAALPLRPGPPPPP